MKTLFSFIVLLASSTSFAQMIMDQQIHVDHRIALFPSANEPGIIYMLPQAINRLSDVQVTSVGDRVTVQFDVGITEAEYARVDALLAAAGMPDKKSAVVRSAEVVAEEGTNIDPKYRPRVTVVGDIRNITGPVRYVLSVRNRGLKTTGQMLKDLFSDKNVDHVLQLNLNFPAQSGGQPYEGKTAVPVLVGTRDGVKPYDPPKTGVAVGFFEAPIAPKVLVLMDRDTNCWSKPEAGVICLR